MTDFVAEAKASLARQLGTDRIFVLPAPYKRGHFRVRTADAKQRWAEGFALREEGQCLFCRMEECWFLRAMHSWREETSLENAGLTPERMQLMRCVMELPRDLQTKPQKAKKDLEEIEKRLRAERAVSLRKKEKADCLAACEAQLAGLLDWPQNEKTEVSGPWKEEG